MSVQTNQYLIWGIRMPYEWHFEWEEKNRKPEEFSQHFEGFMDDSAYREEVKHKDGIFCLFDGMNGNFIFLGRVIQKSKDGDLLAEGGPILISDNLTPLEKELIQGSVERNFGVTGEFGMWLVTMFR